MVLKPIEAVVPTHDHRRNGAAQFQGAVNRVEVHSSDLRVDSEGW